MSGELITIDGEQVALPEPRHELAAGVSKHIPRVIRLLPTDADRVQFATALMIACNELDPNKVSDARSVLAAALGSVRLGLMPGAELGLCYFVPFKGRVNLIPGYRGYLDLATSNSYLRWVATEVVYRGEEFRQWADERGPHVTHEIPLERSGDDRDIIGAYCTYQTRLGDLAVPVVVNRKQIEAARDTNKYGTVWGQHFAEMAMKTAIRRAAKRWKITPQLGRALYLDELAERGEPQPADLPGDIAPEAPRRRRLSDLPEKPADAVPASVTDDGPSMRFVRLSEQIDRTDSKDTAALDDLRAEVMGALTDEQVTPEEHAELVRMLAGKVPF